MSEFGPQDTSVIKVRLLRGERVIRSYKLKSDVFTIGSAEGCDLRAAGDTSVAGRHATLYAENGELTLVPEPGAIVLLNGNPVDFAVPQPSDVVQIGRLTLRVELADALDSVVPVPGAQPTAKQPSQAPARVSQPAPARVSKQPSQAPASSAPAPSAAASRPSVPARPSAAPAVPSKPVKYVAPPSKEPQPYVDEDAATRVVRHPMDLMASDKKKAQGPTHDSATPVMDVRAPEVERHDQAQRASQAPRKTSGTPEQPYIDRTIPLGAVPSLEQQELIEKARLRTNEAARREKTSSKIQPLKQALKFKDALLSRKPKAASVAASAPLEDPSEIKLTPERIESLYALPDDEWYFSDSDADEDTFVEPFSLSEQLVAAPVADAQVERESYLAGQITRMVGDRVAQAISVLPRKGYVSRTKELRCRMRRGVLKVRVRENFEGTVRRGGADIPLSKISTTRRWRKFNLKKGDLALVAGTEGTYKIDVYHPPLPPKDMGFRFNKNVLKIVGFAFGFHVIFAIVGAILTPLIDSVIEESKEEVFAVVEMKEQKKKEKPKPKKKRPKKKLVKNATAMAEKAPKVTATNLRKRIKDRKDQPSGSVENLLSVLVKNTGTAGASDNLKDLVSNIDAVAAGAGGKPTFSIAGAIASLPGGVNIARQGGGGDISTLSGEDVAGKGTGIGNVGGAKRGKGKVRGKVSGMSSRAKVKGQLDKAAVQRVINGATHAIQGCYEKQLLQKPSLAGRIVFDWTITTKGTVKGVRVRSSTLGSSKVASCISRVIKRLKFPRPKGGEVQISYPFLFRSVQ